MELKYDVFISYSHCDRKVAEALCGYLESRGLRCFIDYRDIPRGAFWARIIPPALRASGVMVAVYSDDYNRSVQVERELAIADNSGIPILPFRLSDHPFGDAKSYYFETLNWLDAFPEPRATPAAAPTPTSPRHRRTSFRRPTKPSAPTTMPTRTTTRTAWPRW